MIKLSLPSPPPKYTEDTEQYRNSEIEQAFLRVQTDDGHVEIYSPRKLLMRSPSGIVYEILVSDGGVLSAALPT